MTVPPIADTYSPEKAGLFRNPLDIESKNWDFHPVFQAARSKTLATAERE